NYDIVGNNTPVFFLNDPIKFPDFIHSQNKNPRTNLPDPAAAFEFWANHPQSLPQMTILMSDRGIPASYRHMHGFGSHTLGMWNAKCHRYWVKWHVKTNHGINTVTTELATQLPPLGAPQHLVEAIDRGDSPSWTGTIQVTPASEPEQYHLNPFHLTKV